MLLDTVCMVLSQEQRSDHNSIPIPQVSRSILVAVGELERFSVVFITYNFFYFSFYYNFFITYKFSAVTGSRCGFE